MNKQQLQQLFPNLENEVYDSLFDYGSIKEIKAGETSLRVGQNIRSSFFMIKDDNGRELLLI